MTQLGPVARMVQRPPPAQPVLLRRPAGGPVRSAPLPGSTSTIRGPSGASSATSTGMLSSHSLAMTSPRIRAGSAGDQRIRSSHPGERGAISTARGTSRWGKESPGPSAAGPVRLVLRERQDLAQQLTLAGPDVHQVEPVRVAERGVRVPEQG